MKRARTAVSAIALARSAVLEVQAREACADLTLTGNALRAELLATGLVRDLGRYGCVFRTDEIGRTHAAREIYFAGDGREADMSEVALGQPACDPDVRAELVRLRGLEDKACRKVFAVYDRSCAVVKDITGVGMEADYDHAK